MWVSTLTTTEQHQPALMAHGRSFMWRVETLHSLAQRHQNIPDVRTIVRRSQSQKTSRSIGCRIDHNAATATYISPTCLHRGGKSLFTSRLSARFAEPGAERHAGQNMFLLCPSVCVWKACLPLYCSELPVRIFTVPLIDSPGL